jgi:hypothetical protein
VATADLKAAAVAADEAKAASAATLATDTVTDQHNALAVTATHQAFHDDLAANGSWAEVVQGPPVSVVIYAAVDPADFSTTIVRTT